MGSLVGVEELAEELDAEVVGAGILLVASPLLLPHALSARTGRLKATTESTILDLRTTLPLLVINAAVPPAGFEPALVPPEGTALSPELRGLKGRYRLTVV